MSQVKREMEEQEHKKQNQKNGYRKMLNNKNIYSMDCPYCENALSYDDVREDECIHCKQQFPWNSED